MSGDNSDNFGYAFLPQTHTLLWRMAVCPTTSSSCGRLWAKIPVTLKQFRSGVTDSKGRCDVCPSGREDTEKEEELQASPSAAVAAKAMSFPRGRAVLGIGAIVFLVLLAAVGWYYRVAWLESRCDSLRGGLTVRKCQRRSERGLSERRAGRNADRIVCRSCPT